MGLGFSMCAGACDVVEDEGVEAAVGAAACAVDCCADRLV